MGDEAEPFRPLPGTDEGPGNQGWQAGPGPPDPLGDLGFCRTLPTPTPLLCLELWARPWGQSASARPRPSVTWHQPPPNRRQPSSIITSELPPHLPGPGCPPHPAPLSRPLEAPCPPLGRPKHSLAARATDVGGPGLPLERGEQQRGQPRMLKLLREPWGGVRVLLHLGAPLLDGTQRTECRWEARKPLGEGPTASRPTRAAHHGAPVPAAPAAPSAAVRRGQDCALGASDGKAAPCPERGGHGAPHMPAQRGCPGLCVRSPALDTAHTVLCTHTQAHTRTHVHMHTCAHTLIHIHMLTVCLCVCVPTHICAHTCSHAHSPKLYMGTLTCTCTLILHSHALLCTQSHTHAFPGSLISILTPSLHGH